MIHNLKSIKKKFDVISLIKSRVKASFVSIYYINLTLINK